MHYASARRFRTGHVADPGPHRGSQGAFGAVGGAARLSGHICLRCVGLDAAGARPEVRGAHGRRGERRALPGPQERRTLPLFGPTRRLQRPPFAAHLRTPAAVEEMAVLTAAERRTYIYDSNLFKGGVSRGSGPVRVRTAFPKQPPGSVRGAVMPVGRLVAVGGVVAVDVCQLEEEFEVPFRQVVAHQRVREQHSGVVFRPAVVGHRRRVRAP
mmetsp:Transcript_19918/g.67424  ORF Transcript_19918/g.67424 Transcript_19918/m.67424 type:complete len:213 (+) Transcript_19918:845-1483(+)